MKTVITCLSRIYSDLANNKLKPFAVRSLKSVEKIAFNELQKRDINDVKMFK